MTNSYVVKRLLAQASVTVLAGLLMSSAMLAEDSATDGEEGSVSVDVSIDPPALGVEDQGAPDEPGVTECGFEFEKELEITVDPVDGDVTLDDGATDGATDGEVTIDPVDDLDMHPVDPIEGEIDGTVDDAVEDAVEDVPVEAMQNDAPSVTGAGDGPTKRDDHVDMRGRDKDVPALRPLASN